MRQLIKAIFYETTKRLDQDTLTTYYDELLNLYENYIAKTMLFRLEELKASQVGKRNFSIIFQQKETIKKAYLTRTISLINCKSISKN